MNKVYYKNRRIPLSPEELAKEANALSKRNLFKPSDFIGENSRIAGEGHCSCGGNGEFELLPEDDPDVVSGGKRYMVCRKCGGWSHL